LTDRDINSQDFWRGRPTKKGRNNFICKAATPKVWRAKWSHNQPRKEEVLQTPY